jgi:hypothetical protein
MTAWTSVQLRVDVEAVNPLERAQDGGQKQLCVPLVPLHTYWYLTASPELMALVSGRMTAYRQCQRP